MEKVQWKVKGMDCSTCAINIHRYLEKQGMKNVKVNFATGDVLFDTDTRVPEEKLTRGISDLGYKVVDEELPTNGHAHGHAHDDEEGGGFLNTHLKRFWFCLPFTAILLLHMFPCTATKKAHTD